MKLSICIVNYNTKSLTLKAIESIETFYKQDNYEVILVDNSDQFSQEDLHQFKHVTLVHSFRNNYFSGGFNLAAKHAQGEYLLIMSSDIILQEDSISKLLSFMEETPQAGAVAATMLYHDTKQVIKTSSKELTKFRDFVRRRGLTRALFKNIYDDYSYTSWDRKSIKEVEVITNAFMIIKRSLFKEIQGFEEAMKLYFTEERMCDLIRARGLKIYHHGETQVYHHESTATKTLPSKWIKHIYKIDRETYFFLKHQK